MRLYEGERSASERFLKARFELDDGRELWFTDPRRFGEAFLIDDTEFGERFERLGVEPLSDEFTPEAIGERAAGRVAPLKSFLLDQSHIAGVGNIYADEALFRARIRPTRRAGRLSRPESLVLVAAMKRVLRRSIETSGRSVGDAEEEEGPPRDERRVYGRAGQPCRRCRTPIRRVVIAGRSAHFCPRCQR
jgi:formamidopyrimidine-DNA glycosylase